MWFTRQPHWHENAFDTTAHSHTFTSLYHTLRSSAKFDLLFNVSLFIFAGFLCWLFFMVVDTLTRLLSPHTLFLFSPVVCGHFSASNIKCVCISKSKNTRTMIRCICKRWRIDWNTKIHCTYEPIHLLSFFVHLSFLGCINEFRLLLFLHLIANLFFVAPASCMANVLLFSAAK